MEHKVGDKVFKKDSNSILTIKNIFRYSNVNGSIIKKHYYFNEIEGYLYDENIISVIEEREIKLKKLLED